MVDAPADVSGVVVHTVVVDTIVEVVVVNCFVVPVPALFKIIHFDWISLLKVY